MEEIMQTKVCPTCKQTKNMGDFLKSGGRCKVCKGEYTKAYKKRKREEFSSVNLEGTKHCNKCGQDKPKADFYVDKGNSDHLDSRCKTCKFEYTKAYKKRKREEFTSVNLEGMKHCNTCEQDKPKSDFSLQKSNSDHLDSRCKVCGSEQGRRARQANRLVRTEYKQGGPCVDCGETNPLLFQFDHVRGEKEGSVSAMWSTKRIIEEIPKTDIRCVNCHRVKSTKEAKKRRVDPSTPKQEYRRKIQKRNVTYVHQAKTKIGGCQKCNKKVCAEDEANFSAFDFDHIDPSQKVFCISKMMFSEYSLKTIQKEIDKCQLLCAGCHWLKTGKQLNYLEYS